MAAPWCKAASSGTWNRPHSDVYDALNAECVHVWRAQLDLAPAVRSHTVLSAGESARAARFRFERDRLRFELGHVMLRRLLGRYLGRSPGVLRFVNNVYGKPALDDPDASLRFNLSHSRDTILCAVTVAHDVGVDVEFVRRDVDCLGIAATSFGAADCQRLEELPREQAVYAFFELWVQREALLKAEGLPRCRGPRTLRDTGDVPGMAGRSLTIVCRIAAPGRKRHVDTT